MSKNAYLFIRAEEVLESKLSPREQTGFLYSVYQSKVLGSNDLTSIMGIQRSQLRKAFSKGNSIRPHVVRAVATAVLDIREP